MIWKSFEIFSSFYEFQLLNKRVFDEKTQMRKWNVTNSQNVCTKTKWTEKKVQLSHFCNNCCLLIAFAWFIGKYFCHLKCIIRCNYNHSIFFLLLLLLVQYRVLFMDKLSWTGYKIKYGVCRCLKRFEINIWCN